MQQMGVVLLVNFPSEILAQNLALRKNSFQQNLIINSFSDKFSLAICKWFACVFAMK